MTLIQNQSPGCCVLNSKEGWADLLKIDRGIHGKWGGIKRLRGGGDDADRECGVSDLNGQLALGHRHVPVALHRDSASAARPGVQRDVWIHRPGPPQIR